MSVNKDINKLSAIKDSALGSLIDRMRSAEDTSKAPYTLAELLQENRRRKPAGIFSAAEVGKLIIQLVAENGGQPVSYGEVWSALRPDEPWHMHKSRKEIGDVLDRLSFYCIRHGMPLIGTLVINKSEKDLTDPAKKNVYAAAKERGMDVGLDREGFVSQQQQMARNLAVRQWPEDS